MLKKRKSDIVKYSVVGGFIAALLIVAALLWGQPLLELLGDQKKAEAFIVSMGIFGPLVFILLQVLQVVVAPIPGQVSGLIGGYLFGVTLGTVYSLIGATIGFFIVFMLARKLGRPFVERFFKKEHIEKFDYITKSKGTLALFIIFLLPAFPDDLICYLAGLTSIPIRKLLLVSIAGRLPGYLILSMTGSGLSSYENMNRIIIMLAAVLIVFALAFWQRKWLHNLTKSEDYISYIKNNWKLSKRATILWFVALALLSVFLVWAATVTPIQQ